MSMASEQKAARNAALLVLRDGPFMPTADTDPDVEFALDLLVASGEATWTDGVGYELRER